MLYQIEKRAYPITTQYVTGLSPIPHIHTHLELIYLSEGSTLATVDNNEFLVEKGDLFLAFPNQIHFYHASSPVSGYLFIFAIDLFKELKELFQNNVPTSPIIKFNQFSIEVNSLLNMIMEKNNSDYIYDKIVAKGYLLALLGECLSLMTYVQSTSNYDNIKNVLHYCSQNYTKPLTLDTLAKDLHLNKYYISHIFKERMNIGFIDFVNSLRIEHACNLLEKGGNITDVCFSSGFSSIRTFNRVFAENVGMPPREYIKNKVKNSIVIQ